MRFLLVGLAGAAGAMTRHGLNEVVGPRSFPWATLAINVTGSFLLGLALTLAAERGWSPEAVAAVGTGFLGAYTTFSTFTWEAFTLGKADRLPTAALYLVISVITGVAAAAAGYSVAKSIA